MEEPILPEEGPEIKIIFELIDKLLLEVRMDGSYARVPPETRPTQKEVPFKEANEAILLSLDIIRLQLRSLVKQLARLDPEYFDARLTRFLEEWPQRHPGENLFFFWTFKFFIEAQIEMMRLNP